MGREVQICKRFSERREKHRPEDGSRALAIAYQALQKIGILLARRAIRPYRGESEIFCDDPIAVDLAGCDDWVMAPCAKFGANGEKGLQIPWRAEGG